MSVRTLSDALDVAQGRRAHFPVPRLVRLAAELERSRDEAGSRSAVVRCLWATGEVAG